MSRNFVNQTKGVARDGRDEKSVILRPLLSDCQLSIVNGDKNEKMLNGKL